jgi:hypothetical protein
LGGTVILTVKPPYKHATETEIYKYIIRYDYTQTYVVLARPRIYYRGTYNYAQKVLEAGYRAIYLPIIATPAITPPAATLPKQVCAEQVRAAAFERYLAHLRL